MVLQVQPSFYGNSHHRPSYYNESTRPVEVSGLWQPHHPTNPTGSLMGQVYFFFFSNFGITLWKSKGNPKNATPPTPSMKSGLHKALFLGETWHCGICWTYGMLILAILWESLCVFPETLAFLKSLYILHCIIYVPETPQNYHTIAAGFIPP